MTAAHRLGIEELEARILYSADAALLMGGGPVADVRSLDSASATSATPTASHWLVVDRRVEDWDLTLADRQGQAGAGAALSVRFVEAGEDGQQSLADVPQGDTTEVLPWTDAQGQRWLGTSRLDAPEAIEVTEAAVSDRWEAEVRHELVIIDGALDGASQLAMDWWSRATAACQLDVVVTDPSRDGLAQVTALLSTRQNLSAVHLVSHGDAGLLRLGTTTVDVALLQSRATEVSAWGQALSDEADLLVYGCDVAQGLDGAAFVNLLAGLTGADVAASDDLTGATDLGGDWALEYRQGVIAAASLPDTQTVSALQDWQGVLNTYTVTNLNDSGAGSLRQAITNANGHGSTDTITFSTFGTINLASALPQVTSRVTIDGTSGGAPGVVLNGGNSITNGLELVAGSDGSTVRGLVLQRFTSAGLAITSGSNTIVGNYIGTDVGGNVANGNAIGINVFDAANNVIGGTTAADRNVISGNTNIGINITGAGSAGTVVQGNYIGTNASGSADLGNTWHGVFVNDTSGVTIGGTTAGAGNVVSGNGSVSGASGITLGLSATGNLVAGNTVGLNAVGTGVLANAGVGIYVLGSANTIGGTTSAARNVVSGNATVGINLSGTGATGNTVLGNYIGTSVSGLSDLGNGEDGLQIDTGASFNTIGGLGAESRNVVAGNNNAGIAIDHAASTGNTVLGNYIGLGADGSTPLANSHNGINVSQATDTVIGSTSVAGRNVIASNTMNGLGIADATGTLVQGNYIGTDATGTIGRGNSGDGIRVTGAADGTVIGGAAVGAGNFITNNFGDGVLVNTTSGSTITLLGNAITANSETGIDLGADNGVTANDLFGDGDTGANNLQNFPVLSSASSSPAGTTIIGSLTTNAGGTYRIDFYANHLGGEDGTGYGEGERYLGYTTVSSGLGTVVFAASLTAAWVNQGDRVTATATVDLGGGVYGATSEFAMNVVASASGVVVVDTTADSVDGNTTSITALGNSRGGDQRISLREAITAVNNTANGATPDKIVFGLNGTDAHTIALASLLPSITQAVDIDGTTDDSFAAQGSQPAIVLDGGGVVMDGLQLYAGSSGSSVRGLNIQRFTQDGIDIASSNGNTVAGNWFGVATDGVTARGNQQGINLWTASNNVIGGASAADRNLISGNHVGLWIGGGGAGNQVLGNYLGTTASGLAALGNSTEAILIQDSAGNTIGGVLAGQGNVISGNAVAGIVIGGTANEILGNYIGLDATGQVALGNGDYGVFLGDGAINNQIGSGLSGAGNVISGNAEGVVISQGASSNKVQGNLIGLAADGVTEVGNTTVGVHFYQGGVPGAITGNIIGTNADGSNDSGERNVISGNANGIVLADADVTGNTVAGNYIGTDVTGLLDRGNTFDGVQIAAGATSNTVGGTLVAQRNVISGNGDDAVEITDEATDGNTVSGNWLGVNAAGTGPLGNGGDGIFITGGADNSVIGGTGANSGNWIAGAGRVGIEVDGASSGTLIQGNRIGTDLAGSANWGSLQNGVLLEGGATNNQVGGTAAGAGNVIAFSGQGGGAWTSGISISGNSTTGNAVLGNTVYSSVGLGLDLGISGLAVNDTGDADTGANSLQNFPVLATARTDGSSQLILTGTLNSNASSYYRIEFFANTSQDATGYGEGQRYLGYANVATNGSGNATISTTLSASVAVGEYLSATATKSNAAYSTFTDTSEFARSVVAVSSTQAVLTVDTASDASDGDTTSISTLLANKGTDGSISLREAITAANNSANGTSADRITFSISGTGVHTINVGSALPSITGAVILDATTDDSFAANGSRPAIVLDGSGAGGGVDGLTLQSGASGSTVKGFSIVGFSNALSIAGSNNTIQANYLGVNATGSTAVANASGVSIIGGSGNLIGGTTAAERNVISGNTSRGIYISGGGATGNFVQGNYIGLNAAGTAAIANQGTGIEITSAGNTVGGTTAGAGNVVSGNAQFGIMLAGASANSNTVAGNYVGLNAAGTAAVGNGDIGIFVRQGASSNTVGGATAASRNVVSGNTQFGVTISDGTTSGNTVQNNYLGTNAAGDAAISNGGFGLVIDFGAVNTSVLNNVISGNTNVSSSLYRGGIYLSANGATIQGNLIGLNAAGTAFLGNGGGSSGGGIFESGTSTGALIGGTSVGQGNTIAGNTGAGVTVNAAGNIEVLGNAIYSNSGLGIDLANNGVTVNDSAPDADTGANNLQNFPVLATARTDGSSQLILTGTLNSNASSYYRIEFFANTGQDATGYGEGQRYLGYANVATNGSGNATISTTLSASVAVGEYISATATKSESTYTTFTDTSEFAHSIAAVSSAQAVVTVDTASDTSDGDMTSLSTLLANKGADGFISLREAITAANNTANGTSADKITFAIAGTGVHTITVGSALPTITGTVVLDATTDDSFAANGSRPAIVLNGNGLNVNGLRLGATADGSTIRGLVINNFGFTSITIDSGSSGNTIAGNYLGHLDTSGHFASGLPASSYFVLVQGDNNVIGGASAADRNVFASAGGNYGLFVETAGAFSNRITGNYFGTDATGNAVVGGAFAPIALWSSGANNQIGGSGANEGNVVASNGSTAILLNNASTGTLVQGNRIGVSANGSLLSSVGTAVYVGGSDSTSLLNNWIAGTSGDSIVVSSGVVGTTVQGNRIGTDLTGTVNWGGQSNGLYVAGTNSLIGGTGVGQGNIIANSNQAGGSSSGVYVAGGAGNAILGNAIHDTQTGTGGLGIDLGLGGVTANDVGDADTGANNLQNTPVLTSASNSGVNTTVVGSLNSNASTTYRIEFFSSPSGDASGHGEGVVYLGATTVTTNAGGNANFSATLTGVTLTAGHAVSATATVDLGGGSYGSTSEFAANVMAPAPAIVVQHLSHTSEGQASGSFSVVLTEAPTADVTIAVSVGDPTELSVGTSTLTFTSANWNVTQVVTVSGVDDTIVDGDVWSTVTLAPAVSADVNYNGLNPTDVSVQNADNDTFSTVVVDTVADTVDADTSSIVALYANKGADGRISLREAITAANNTANGTSPDKIVFDIGDALVSGAHTINLASTLPTVSDAVVIDASTEPDCAGAPVVNVSGGGTLSNGFTVSASNSTIRGLSITGFTSAGILLSGNGNTVAGNWLGVRPDNSTSGADMPHGILVTGSGNLTGGSTAADRNIIVNTTYSGVFVNGGAANNNTISGNYFGLLANGTTVSSLYYSVTIQNTASGTLIGTNGDGVNDAGEGNLFGSGTMRVGPGGMGTLTVAGNWLGLNAAGATTGSGGTVQVTGGTTVRFGTDGDGLSDSLEANVMAGNINVSAAASNLSIAGNFIGVAADGSTSLGNTQAGITISGNARGTIGGISAAMANTIASTAGDGIAITGTGASVSVLGNAIRLNGGLGIDLSDNGVTTNDAAPDADTGPNGLQNFPVLATARTDGSSQLLLTGTLNSTASSYHRIEFFANTSQDATGYGEGQRYLGYANVATDASGNATISATLSASIAVGEFISATATKSDATYTAFTDTSEFGHNIAAVSNTQAVVTVDTAADTSDGDTSSLSTLLANKGADGFISLREAITAANNTANGTSADQITFAIAGTGVHTITVGTALPSITGAVVLDASTDDSFAANGNQAAIVLDGNALNASGLTLAAGSGGSTVRGFSLVDFGQYGLRIDFGSDGNTIEGNLVGLGADGSTAAGNGQAGISVASSANTIGGVTALARNVLSGNTNAGLSVNGSNNLITGNYIGTDVTGTLPLGNAQGGIWVGMGTANTTIGGTAAGAGNLIAWNQGTLYQGGVLVESTVSGLSMLGNAFQGNTGLALDLGMDGLTANDAGDTDTGANALQNFPLLYSADLQGADVRVRGEVNTTAGTTLRIEFFSSPLGTEDPTGYGEGAVFLGYTEVTTDGAGRAALDVTLNGVAPASGDRVSATATVKTGASTYGATSEFSMNVPAALPNQAPVITLSGYSGSYTENAAVVFDPGATLTDSDNPVFTGGNLIYQITANGTTTDELGIRNQGTGVGQIGLSGSNVTHGGVVIGTFTGFGNGSTPLVVTFNGNATTAAVQALLRNITYRDTSDNPSTATRSISLTVSDGSGGTSTPAVVSMAVVAVNDAPVLTNGGSISVSEDSAGVPFFGVAPLIDADNASFNGGTLTATISAGGELSDVLQVTGGSSISTSGVNVMVNGVTVGTWSGGGGWPVLVVSFNANATVARAQAVYEAIGFSSTSESPTAGLRTVSVVLTDGSGGTSNTATGQVNLTPVNDAPVFSNLNGAPVYTEGGAAVVLDADVTVSDAELTAGDHFSGATLVLVRQGGTSAQDVFSATGTLAALTEGGNLVVGGTTIGTVTTNLAGTLVLTFNASATNARVNAVMQQIAYANSSSAPPASVQLDWAFSDGNTSTQGTGGVLSATGSTTVTVLAVNNAPAAPVVTRYLSDLTPLAASVYTFNQDTDHGGGPIVLDGTTYAKGLGMHPGAAGDGFGYVDYAVDGATAFKATLGVNDFQSGTYGQVRFHVYLDGVAVYSSPSVTSASDLIALDIDTTGASTLRLAVDNDSNGNAFDHAVWAQARLEGGTVALDAVPEGAANGTVVGSVASTDPDAGETLTYGLTDSAGGRFAVQATTGRLTVADGSLLDAESAGSHAIVVRVTDSGGLFRETAFTVQVNGVNEVPALGGLGGSVSFTEGASAVVLAPAASVTDPELSAADNFSGATLTLARHGGANAEDQLAFDGTTVTVSGVNLFVGGVQVGTYGFTGGQLDISLGSGATQARVNALLQHIVYWNASDTPPASVQIDWTFSDANSGAQGTGGVLATTGSTTVIVSTANDAPTFTGLDGTPVHTEDGAATVLDATVQIADAELSTADQFNGATLTLARNGGASAQDLFSATGTLGALAEGGPLVVGGTTIGTVTTNSAGTLVLTFGAGATNALVNAALQQIAYANGSDTPPASVQIDWTFSDGNTGAQGAGGASVTTGSVTVSVVARNDAPTGADARFTVAEDGMHTFSAADFGFTDVDGHALLAVQVTTLPAMGMLQLVGVEVGAGQVIGVADLANLRFVPNPGRHGTAFTAFTFQVIDDGGTTNGGTDTAAVPSTITFDVTPANDAPVLALDGTNLVANGSFEAGAVAWTGNSGVETSGLPGHYQVAAPPDGSQFAEVEGWVSSGVPSYLEQVITTEVGRTYVFSLSAVTRLDTNTFDMGMLSVEGVELGRFTSSGNWDTHAVSFTATSTTSTLRITSLGSQTGVGPAAGDGGGLLIDDVRVVAVDAAAAFTEDAPAVLLAGGARVVDAELGVANNFSGATLTLARNGGASAQDQFSATGTLGALAEGGVLVVGGTTIGTVTVNSAGTLVLTFDANATNARVNAAMQQIAYANSSDTPPATVQIDWTFSDGNSAAAQGTGGPLTATGHTAMAITAVNDAPVLTLSSSSGTYVENDPAVSDAGAVVSDVDSADFDGGVLTYAITANGTASDELAIRDEGTGAGQIGLSGNTVTYGSVTIGTHAGFGNGSTPLVVTFNSNADAAAVQALLRNITYRNTSDDPDSAVRTVQIDLTDGDGGSVTPFIGSLSITPVNDAPVITSSGALTLVENTSTVGTVTASDVDLGVATLHYSLVGGADAALFSLDAVTGVLRFLSAPDHEAPLDANADNVYQVVVRASDGQLSDTSTVAITVTDVSNALVVTTTADTVDGDTSSIEALNANAGADGRVSLREALLAANQTANALSGPDRITFSIADPLVGGAHTIVVATDLPTVADAVVIDGSTEPDAGSGPVIVLDGAGVATTGLHVAASDTTVRGLVISRFTTSGLLINSGAANVLIAGNRIGTDVTGLLARGNGQWGIDVIGAGTGLVIGGATVADRNVIGANTGQGGVAINATNGATVLGNYIGVGADGTTALGNATGILLFGAASGTRIGGTAAGEGNLIANNSGDGIGVWPASTGNALLGNLLRANAGLGIDLNWDAAVQANDVGDADAFQNHPVLSDAYRSGSDTVVEGTLNSTAGTTLRIEFFSVPAASADVNGHGEAPVYLGFTEVTTDGTGAATFSARLVGVTTVAGDLVTATATVKTGAATYGRTSEFSANLAVTSSAAPVLSFVSGHYNYSENAGPVVVAPGASVSDPDSPNFAGGRVVVYFAANGQAEDRIAVRHQGSGPGQIGLSGSTVLYGGVAIGTWAGGTDGATPLTVTLNAAATPTATQALLRNITYANVSDNPSTAVRTMAGYLEDGAGGTSNTVSGTIGVLPSNDTPVAHAGGSYAIAEGDSLVLDASASSDPDDAVLSYAWDLNGNGVYGETGDPTAAGATVDWATLAAIGLNDNGSHTIAVRVTDAQGASSVATATLLIADSAPVMTLGGTGRVTAGQPYTLTLSASDAGADTITSWTIDWGDGTVAAYAGNPGSVVHTYTRSGTTFSVLASVVDEDGTHAQNPLQAHQVLVDNAAPLLTSNGGGASATVSLAENTTAVTTVTATDIDQPVQTLIFSIAGGADAARFTIDAATGALSFRTAPNYEAPSDANADNVYDVTVQVSDGILTASQSIAVTVTDVNDNAPAITSGNAVSVAENATSVVAVTASDADQPAQTLAFSITGGADAARFTIDAATGALSFRTAPDYEVPSDANADNVYDVTVQVSDGSLTASQSIAVTLTDVNDNTPTITSGSAVSVAENATVVTTVTASDADQPAQTLMFSIAGGADAARFAIDAATGALSFRTAPDYEVPSDANADNVYDVTVQVSDGSLTASQSIAVTVTDVNDNTPAITSGGVVSVVENATAVTTVAASDADQPAQTLTFSITGGADAARFTIDSATGVLSFRSAPDYETPSDANADNVYDVTVQVSDGSLTASQSIAVTVTDVNDNTPAIISGSAVSVAENATAVTTVAASDADQPAQTLTFSITGGADAAWFTIDTATGVLSFRTAPDYEAPMDVNADNVYDVKVQVSDGSLTVSQSIAVTVTDLNDNTPTTTSGDAVSVAENTTAVMTVTASDADRPAQTLTFSITGGADAARFTIDSATGALSFVAAPDHEAPSDTDADNVYEVTVQVNDGGLSTNQSIAVTVNPVNDNVPQFTSDWQGADVSAMAPEGERWSATVPVVDADLPAQGLHFDISGGADAALFELDPVSGLLTFRPVADFEAPQDANRDNAYEVEVTVGDGEFTVHRTLTLLIANVNEAPVLLTSQVSVGQGGRVTLDTSMLQAGDPDTDATALVYTVSDVRAGVFVRAATPDEAIERFTQAEVLAGEVVFIQSGEDTEVTRFDLTVSDGGWVVGPHRVTVQVQPEAPASTPGTGLSPTLGAGFAAATQDNNLIDEPLTGVGDSRVRLDQIMIEIAGADRAPIHVSLPEETANSDSPVSASTPSTTATPVKAAAASPARQIGPMPDLLPGARATPFVGTELSSVVTDLSRLPVSDLLVMLDVPIDLSGFIQDRMVLLQWGSLEERSKAAVESARQSHTGDLGPTLRWDSGDTVQAGGMALSVGLVFWATRASGLVASLAAVAPPWRQFDPLPVLSVHAPRQPEGTEVDWLDTDISGSLADLAEDILDHRT